MLVDNLFQSMLIKPAVDGADELLIVSGYATSSMAMRHISQLTENNLDVPISLVVGMAPLGAVNKPHHKGFQNLAKGASVNGAPYNSPFSCLYLVKGEPCHSKVFVWNKNGQPIKAFAGSANYTLTGFGKGQIESVGVVDPQTAFLFYKEIAKKSKSCVSSEIESLVRIADPSPYNEIKSEDKITLPLTTKGEVPTTSGLNWGQRPGRNRDQAYLSLPAEVRRTGFFPGRGQPFTVLTDDGKSFIMWRMQDEGKALHTPESNALLGRYFRDRMGLQSGAFVTKEHLLFYGRLDVDFYKIEPETYLMDFSPNPGPGEKAEK